MPSHPSNPTAVKERESIVSLHNITVRRNGTAILDSISLDIAEGEHTAIIGANGAGKSTLVQVISQEIHPLWQPQSSCMLFGRERWNVLELRKHLGIVSQSLQYLCNTTFSARDIVLSGFFSSIGLDFSSSSHRCDGGTGTGSACPAGSAPPGGKTDAQPLLRRGTTGVARQGPASTILPSCCWMKRSQTSTFLQNATIAKLLRISIATARHWCWSHTTFPIS